MGNELQGLHVLNTRPAGQAEGLSAALRAAGARVSELPLLAIEPMAVTGRDRQHLLDLDRYDYCFFASANAARLGLLAIGEFWPQWPHRLPAIAVGRGTAAVLEEVGLSVLRPVHEDSEGVLALPGLHEVDGRRFLLLRGEDGREMLANTLRMRGARVDIVPLYRRVLPVSAAQQWAALRQDPPAWVVLTSPAAWRHWRDVAGAAATGFGLVVVSPRLNLQVREAGATRVRLADGASSEAIVKALLGSG